VTHHDALRARFEHEAGGWRQEVAPPEGAPLLRRIELPSENGTGRAAAVTRAASEVQAGLDLSRGPLVGAALIRAGEAGSGRLLLAVHHLCVDAVSWRILREDLEAAYEQLGRGEAVRLPAKTTSFKTWAERLAAHARSDEVRAEADAWVAEQEGEGAELPGRGPGENRAGSVRLVSASLGPDETRRLLREAPRVHDAEITELLLAALGVALLGRGPSSILVDLERHGREALGDDIDTSRTVGWFTSVFPVRLAVPGGTRLPDAVSEVKRRLRRIPRGGIGYGLLRYLGEDTAVAERLRRAPVAEVSFNYLGQLDEAPVAGSFLRAASESPGAWRSPRSRRLHRLEVVAGVTGGRLQVGWHYAEGVDRQEAVEEWSRAFLDALRDLATSSGEASDDTGAMVTEAELGSALSEVEFE
jgi:non-ribosomal peptide synthase protein (TIGR01720 family)